MKKLQILLLSALALVSCNEISYDDRYVPVESVAPQRAVIIEDFTGQNCVNCPAAHRTIEKLVEQYGDNVIPVSIHAGAFAIGVDSKYYLGLMQPEGDEYNDRYGIDEWPKGVVNRKGGATNHDDWPAAVRAAVAEATVLDIDMEAIADADRSNITVNCTLKPSADIDGHLQLWVIEDHIVAYQRDIDLGRIPDYEHNHVYRASINGVGGDAVALKANIHATTSHSIAVRDTEKEKWALENISVVAFVYNGAGVVQAAKAKVAQH